MGMLQEKMPTQAIWKLRLEEFLWWIEWERARRTSPQTLAKYVSHTRGLLEYAWHSGRAERNVLDGFQLQDSKSRAKPHCLTEAEARKLVVSCPTTTSLQRRDLRSRPGNLPHRVVERSRQFELQREIGLRRFHSRIHSDDDRLSQ